MSAPAQESIWKDLGPSIEERVAVGTRELRICRPAESERLLDHPEVRKAFAADEYMPYWADLWPAARMLAEAILHEPWPAGRQALEIGCGLGLPGVAALAAGLRVTFSDYDPCALHFAAENARLNGFRDFDTLRLDWRTPPPGLQAGILLASDLVYEIRNVAPLVAFLKVVLAPEGLCLLTDQDRVSSKALREALQAGGLPFTTRTMWTTGPDGRKLRGTLYRIARTG
ncbi:MAG: methyltransferase [Planctomycetes bacterium]|nr:methyltransferase [Planctomycetota bacterium]